MGGIEVKLIFQRFDAIELTLASQKMGETHSCSLAVQIGFEVKKVRFEEGAVGMFVESRTTAKVDGARMRFAGWTFVPAGIHPVSR